MTPFTRNGTLKRHRLPDSSISGFSRYRCSSPVPMGESDERPPGASPVAPPACVDACPRLMSLPDAVLLIIMEYARYGRRQRGAEEEWQPCVVVGRDKRRGGALPLDPARALASTCKRLRELFCLEFISTFSMFCCQRVNVLVGEQEKMRSSSNTYMTNVLEILVSYSAGVRHLDVRPGFVLFLLGLDGETWKAVCKVKNAPVSLGDICPRLRSVRIGPEIALYSSVLESRASHKKREARTPEETSGCRLLDDTVARLKGVICDNVDKDGMNLEAHLRGALNTELLQSIRAVLFGLHSALSGKLEGSDRDFQLLSRRNGLLSFGEASLSICATSFDGNVKSLKIDGDVLEEFPWAELKRLPVERLEVTGAFLRPRSASLVRSFPQSLTSFKYRLETELPPKRMIHLDVSEIPRLEELDLLVMEVAYHGFPVQSFGSYIRTLETANASNLKRLRLSFAITVFNQDSEGSLPFCFEMNRLKKSMNELCALQDLYLESPFQYFADFLEVGAGVPCSPAVHFILTHDVFSAFDDDYRKHGNPCMFAALDTLRTPEGACVASISFDGEFGCANATDIAKFELEARMICPRFQGQSAVVKRNRGGCGIGAGASSCEVHSVNR